MSLYRLRYFGRMVTQGTISGPRAPVLLATILILFAAASGCGGSSSARKSGVTVSTSKEIIALTVQQVPIPPLGLPNYRTRGTYPEISGNGIALKRVNAALRSAVVNDQRRWARFDKQQPPAPKAWGPGLYKTSPRLKLLSASNVVVSALISLTDLLPGGNDGLAWLSMTVRVPSGSSVSLPDLFAQPKEGLIAVATAFRKRVLSSNRCVKDSFEDPTFGKYSALGFKPTAHNYRFFALTPRGLSIGSIDVAPQACGRVSATIPYATLRPYLSELGKELLSGVRRPRIARASSSR